MEKSPEAFRTISEVADTLQTPAHVLRFWESRFPQIRPVKRAGGRRYYRPTDVALLTGIKHLLHDQGMTIRGVQKILREQGVRHVAAMVGAEAIDAEDQALIEAMALSSPPPADEDAPVFQAVESAQVVALETALARGTAAAPEPKAAPQTAQVIALQPDLSTPRPPAPQPEQPSLFDDHPALTWIGDSAPPVSEDPAVSEDLAVSDDLAASGVPAPAEDPVPAAPPAPTVAAATAPRALPLTSLAEAAERLSALPRPQSDAVRAALAAQAARLLALRHRPLSDG